MPLVFEHNFHSVDSTTVMPASHVGQKSPTPLSGTWGIRSLKGYNVTDVANQSTMFKLDTNGDPIIYELRTAGHLTSGTVVRNGILAFKVLDASNALTCTIGGGGNFVIQKVDAGVNTTLLTVAITKPGNGVEYGLSIVMSGNNIMGFLNGKYIGNVALSGADALKYIGYTGIGMIENKAGAPTTNLDYNRLSVWEGEWPSWQR
jgi:hypothetical protein